MKKAFAALLALSFALALSSCAKQTAWRYELETRTDADDYTARDGTLLSWYVYELPRLMLVSDDAPYGAEPPEDMAAVRDAFNAEIEHCRALLLSEYHDLEQLAIRNYSAHGAEDIVPSGNYIELTETYRTPRLLSVGATGYTDWGGAYPWRFTRCWAFDLEKGEFIYWYDLAKKTDALRGAITAELLRQIREQGLDERCFPGWEDTVEAMEGCEVFLGGDALTVVFGEQQLAPRAAGLPSFEIPYDGLTKYFNSYGKELIKKDG